MTLKFHSSPFHVTHPEPLASKMALKVDLTIMITSLIKKKGFTQEQAAQVLELHQSRISEIKNAKIEKFTVDALLDILDKLGYRASMNLEDTSKAVIEIAELV